MEDEEEEEGSKQEKRKAFGGSRSSGVGGVGRSVSALLNKPMDWGDSRVRQPDEIMNQSSADTLTS